MTTLNIQNDVILVKRAIIQEIEKFLLTNFINDILYDIKSSKSVFFTGVPRIPTLRRNDVKTPKLTSKHQNNVVLAKSVANDPKMIAHSN